MSCVLLISSVMSFTAYAASDFMIALPERKTVRVGYPIQDKLTDKNEHDEYVGYNVDYLNEVVKYTGWDIEYVEVDGDINEQLTTLSDMLDKGEIDMMGTMLMNEYLQELYLYPTYSYGSTYTALVVAEESGYWLTDTFRDWNGIKVASCPALEKRMALLEQFARVSGFTYEVLNYETLEEAVNAVYNGEADATLQVDINIEDGMRAIARFAPTPYYFALAKGREDLLVELNNAMYSLLESYPSLQSELYSRYFMHKGTFHISEADKEWIKSIEPLKVLYFTGNAPVQDCVNGEATGIASKYIERLCEATGLKTKSVFANSYDEGVKLVEDGEVDIIAAMPSNSLITSRFNVKLSGAYFESSAIKVYTNVSINNDTPNLLAANSQDMLNQLKYEKRDVAMIDVYCADYYMRKAGIYADLYAEWANRNMVLYSVGMLPTVDDRLVNIINSFSNSIDESTKQLMLFNASKQPLSYTALELLEIYWWQILTVAIVMFLLGLLFTRMRHMRIMKESAKEAEQLYQFSRMVNECLIRYDAKQDRLMMQNSKIVFENREILQPFMKSSSDIDAKDENENRTISLLRQMLKNRTVSSELELEQNGEMQWYRINLVYINNEYAIGRMFNIDDEVEQRNELERKASVDGLTGLLNRTAIVEYINEYLPIKREGVFLILDLDNFKKVNDTRGHIEGDKVLQSFSKLMEQSFRMEDIKARLGGDEFVVFLPSKLSKRTLEEKLSAFMKNAANTVFADYRDCKLSVSIGAAYISESALTFEDLYRDADEAMYKAKNGGKNKYHIG